MLRKTHLSILVFFFSLQNNESFGTLIYPENTIFQMAVAASIPIDLPSVKLFLNCGFIANYIMPFLPEHFYKLAQWPGLSRQKTRSIDYGKYIVLNSTHPSDLTAGQIYKVIEEITTDLGFHETCLLKSICEMAQHPFNLEKENLLAEIINFILSPSLHNAFGEDEESYKESYEAAEKYGFSGADCHYLYPECPNAFINLITTVLFD